MHYSSHGCFYLTHSVETCCSMQSDAWLLSAMHCEVNNDSHRFKYSILLDYSTREFQPAMDCMRLVCVCCVRKMIC